MKALNAMTSANGNLAIVVLLLALIVIGLSGCTDPGAKGTQVVTQGQPKISGTSAPMYIGTSVDFECGKGRYEQLLGKLNEDLAKTFENVASVAASDDSSRFRWEAYLVCGKLIYFSIQAGLKNQHRADIGRAVDLVIEPTDDISYTMVPGCHRPGVVGLDLSIVVLVKHDNNVEQLPARRAWQLDNITGKIREINTEGIFCVNPSYGHEGD